MKYKITYLLFFSALIVNAQKFGSRSMYEKRWAIFHPIAALKTKAIYKKVTPFYESAKRDSIMDIFENGGKLDAFRHVFFMAAFAQKINHKKIKKLGIAHEKGNYKDFKKSVLEQGEIPDSLSTVMDLFNNDLGIKLGKENRSISIDNLNKLVVKEINLGNALYFKRNKKGNYLKCDGSEIQLKEYDKKWFIPKCLIKTNE